MALTLVASSFFINKASYARIAEIASSLCTPAIFFSVALSDCHW